MSAEMDEQPAVLGRLVDRFDDHAARVRAIVPDRLAGVAFLARGSSDNAAVYGRYLCELAGGRPAGLLAPSPPPPYHARVHHEGDPLVAPRPARPPPRNATGG